MSELGLDEEGETLVPDDRLPLMFACAHPAIDPGIRAPLILQTTLGFDAAAIASAFLVSPATMGQRLVRAKNKIRQAGIPFPVPRPAPLCQPPPAPPPPPPPPLSHPSPPPPPTPCP